MRATLGDGDLTVDTPATVRPNPCPTCPYRRGVPSGIWDPAEYAKLPGYDGQTWAQNPNAFYCHSTPENLCAGWAGHREPADLLAVRLGISRGTLDPSVAEYGTRVALFSSGEEAAAHGTRDVNEPGARARAAADKILRRRGES